MDDHHDNSDICYWDMWGRSDICCCDMWGKSDICYCDVIGSGSLQIEDRGASLPCLAFCRNPQVMEADVCLIITHTYTHMNTQFHAQAIPEAMKRFEPPLLIHGQVVQTGERKTIPTPALTENTFVLSDDMVVAPRSGRMYLMLR